MSQDILIGEMVMAGTTTDSITMDGIIMEAIIMEAITKEAVVDGAISMEMDLAPIGLITDETKALAIATVTMDGITIGMEATMEMEAITMEAVADGAMSMEMELAPIGLITDETHQSTAGNSNGNNGCNNNGNGGNNGNGAVISGPSGTVYGSGWN